MLFPIKEATEAHRAEERSRIEDQGQTVSPRVFYMRQTVGNACGTVGLLHCVANAQNSLVIADNSYLSKFLATTADMTPQERAVYLEQDDEIEVTHVVAASEGQSDQIDADQDVNTHFVCFT